MPSSDSSHRATDGGASGRAARANPAMPTGPTASGANGARPERSAPTAASPSPRRPTLADIQRAYEVVRPHVHHTPLLPSRTLSALTGARIALKLENLQRAGVYKIRGATNKLARLTVEERARGVITASAGNHAQGVALAAAALGVRCTIVMPTGAARAKVAATQGYGATVVLRGANYDAAYEHARTLQARDGTVFIHAFDDPDIIAGQGTLGLEILADQPDVEAVVAGIGGGGLISGVATAIKTLKPDVRVIGVQASGAASMRAALDAGHLVTLPAVNTFADGIATRRAGELTFPIVRELVDDVVTVDDEEIIRAVLLLLERCKQLVEGAGAAGLAALLSGKVKLAGKRTVVVVSGGNIDLGTVGRFIQQGPAARGGAVGE
ncbi:MAG TPA: threonine ammonia-lyase [Ktedonobacterales bacterium]